MKKIFHSILFFCCLYYSAHSQLPGSGNALSFDGADDHVDLGTFFTYQEFTVDMWVKPAGSQVTYADIIDNNHNDNQNWVCQQYIDNTNHYTFGCSKSTGGIVTLFTLTADVWQHVAMIKSSTAVEVYVNGILAGSTPWSGTVNFSGQFLRLGRWGGGGRNWNGSLDEVRIWNTPFNENQIRDRMCRKITSSDPLFNNLVAYYNFDESTGNTVFDGTANAANGTLINGTARLTSGAAIGNASAYNYVTTGLPAANLGFNGEDNLGVVYTGGTYTGEAGTNVYVVNEKPNTETGFKTVGSNYRYFGVFNVNLDAPAYTATYNYTDNPFVAVANETGISLFKRTDNSAVNWANANAIRNTTANTLTVTGQNTEYILGLPCGDIAANISAGGPLNLCEGGSVTLTSSAASSYLWSNGATTQSITVALPGSYTVTVTNTVGCTLTSTPVNVTNNFCSEEGVYQLWGMTPYGGNNDLGIIFNTNAEGNNFVIKHYFDNSNGSKPQGTLTYYKGKLFGTAINGGNADNGVVFQYDMDADSYTKKADFGNGLGVHPTAGLTLLNDKFYGMTPYPDGSVFEYDPTLQKSTAILSFNNANGSQPAGDFSEMSGSLYSTTGAGGEFGVGTIFKILPVQTNLVNFNGPNGSSPYGSLTALGNKFYGATFYGGTNDAGVLFEWDPVLNNLSVKVNLDDAKGTWPWGNLTYYNGKFYGMTYGGGANNSGVIFEWDPVSNVYIKRFDFDHNNGRYEAHRLTMVNGKFYAMSGGGGLYGRGVIFEWDPLTNVYVKKKDFTESDGGYGGGDLTLTKAPVSKGHPGSCKTFPSVTINSSNNNQWVSITDEENNAVAEIKANGNNLGVVTASMFINNGPVRETDIKKLYLDRSITITSQVPPSTPVDLRLYIKGSEYLALKNAVNSNGQPSGINDISDVGVFKVKANCRAAVPSIVSVLWSKPAPWGADYVFSTSVSAFSSYCFANRYYCTAAPVISGVRVSGTLWPPLHSLRTVGIAYATTFNSSACGVVTNWLTVTSNEPQSGTGIGDRSPDWIIVDPHHVKLRAERADNGTGRIYTITIHSKNAAGYVSTYDVQMNVPVQMNSSFSKEMNLDEKFNRTLKCSVTPNPANQYFNLQIQSASDKKIEVNLLDMSGRLISTINTTKDKTTRFGQELKPGMYIVKIIQGEQQQIIKIIKQ